MNLQHIAFLLAEFFLLNKTSNLFIMNKNFEIKSLELVEGILRDAKFPLSVWSIQQATEMKLPYSSIRAILNYLLKKGRVRMIKTNSTCYYLLKKKSNSRC